MSPAATSIVSIVEEAFYVLRPVLTRYNSIRRTAVVQTP